MSQKEKNRIELMAPVGDFSTLVSACNAGADAVYFGVGDFSMRAGKKNFKITELKKIKKICESYPRKPKIYLTLNTIIYEEELKKVEKIIEKAKTYVDAIIVSDFSAIKICKKNNIPFFISTQMSVSNTSTAEFYRELGAKRIVLARELNLKQIGKIIQKTKIEVEVFGHGAMCVAVSGRCFMSQFLFNKSANRGECLHPCRRSYIAKEKEKGHELKVYRNTIFSAKDLCTLPFIEEIKKVGVNSLKIEGRGRDARYVDTVVRVYREALDNKITTERIVFLMKKMEKVFNRGFSSGFYLGKPSFSDFSEFENTASKTKKEFIGKTVHFYSKIGVVLIDLYKDLKVGETISFIGKDTGVREINVKEIEIEKRKVKKGERKTRVGVKVPFKVRNNEEVYRLRSFSKPV